MNRTLILLVLGSALTAADSPGTDYGRARVLRIESETTLTMETVSFSVERDGEPLEVRGGNRSSEEIRRKVQLERVLEHEDGRPTRVRRAFETVEAESTQSLGDSTLDGEHECPLAGVTIEVSVGDDGEPLVEVVEGDEPDDEAVLEGHGLTLALDALLPGADADEGDRWDLDAATLLRALELDLDPAFFPPPSADEPGEEGPRGRRLSRGFVSVAGLLARGEWEGTLTLRSLDEDLEGATCAVIELEARSSGDLPAPELRFGGGRLPRGSRPHGFADNTFACELEGRLYFSLDERRPLRLDVEGTMTTERVNEVTRGEVTMVMEMVREGTFHHVVEVTVEEDG